MFNTILSIINEQIIIEGTKEDYIYFLLKYGKTNMYRIFPLYECMDEFKERMAIKCKECYKINYIVPTDGHWYGANYFFCKYCEKINRDFEFDSFERKKIHVFTHKYVLVDQLYKFKKNNKIGDYYISPKKYKYKITWSKNIVKVNKEIIIHYLNKQKCY